MTIVGKILVFVNLIFSLVVGAFAVMTYTSRFHYDAAFKELNKQYKVAQANAEQYNAEALKAKADADVREATATAAAKSLRDEIDGYKAQVVAARDKAGKAEAVASQAQATADAYKADVARRQADVEKIRETLAKEINDNTTLKKETNDMRDRAVAAEIQSKSLKEIMARMETQLQETNKDLARIKQNVGVGAKGVLTGSANPPPESVEGLIKTADAGGLLKLTIGSDAGLVKGHTLELFRTSPAPKYLGRVRILEVTPHEAVAQPVGRMNAPPQVGDKVASRI